MGNTIRLLGGGQTVHDRSNQESYGQRGRSAARQAGLATVGGVEVRDTGGAAVTNPVECFALGGFPDLHGHLAGTRSGRNTAGGARG